MTINLTLDDKCYTYYLVENLDTLNQLLEDPEVSHADMMKAVADIIRPADYYYRAKPRFYGYILNTKNKEDLYMLCVNAINKAERFIA
jgi:hypothetical protein